MEIRRAGTECGDWISLATSRGADSRPEGGSPGPFGQMIFDQPVADGNRPAGQDVRPQPAAMDEVFDDAGAGEALQVSACRAVLA